MKKKFVIVALMVATIMLLAGCGNQNYFGNYTYTKVHVDTHNHSQCFTVKTWTDSESGIEVNTEEVGSMFLSEGTYILLEGECPFCE